MAYNVRLTRLDKIFKLGVLDSQTILARERDVWMNSVLTLNYCQYQVCSVETVVLASRPKMRS